MINAETSKDSFISYLRSQKRPILITTCASALVFIILKIIFPYPDLFIDSTNYVIWAYEKFNVAYRPTGYAYFLRFTHTIASSATCTVFIQYLLFFISSMFCMLSADYLFGLPQKIKWLLLSCVLFNPLLLFQTNLISSDTIFCSLVVTWLTLLFWIIRKQSWWALSLQVAVLYCCFEVRYTALFLPIVAIIAFIFCTAKWRYKLTGILLSAGIIFFAVQRQKDLNEQQMNARVFSGFAGWQIANNALYCYKYINVDVNDLPSVHLQRLNDLVSRFIDSVPITPGEVGSTFIWDNRSPLKIYQSSLIYYSHVDYTTAWFTVSKLYNEYGWYIVKNFPAAYLRYYILPNAGKYFYPDLEALASYNSSNLTLPSETKTWFGLDINELTCRLPYLQENVVLVFPVISLLLNVFNLAVICLFLFRSIPAWRNVPRHTRVLFITWSLFYLGFMLFSTLASSVNLRFMDPVFVVGLIVPSIFISRLRIAQATPTQTTT